LTAVKALLVFFLICLFLGLAALPSSAEDWKLSGSATFESGKYGTSTTIETLYVPATLKRYFDFGDFSLTVPYVMLRSNGIFTVVNGTAFKVKKQVSQVTTTSHVTQNSGLGDIILAGDIYILKDEPFDFSVLGKVKFPTANSNKGLGTGEFDEAVGAEIGKALTPTWRVFADTYYTFIGSPSGESLKNQFSVEAGVAHQLTRSLTVSLSYFEATPLISGNPDLREVSFNFEYAVIKEFHIFGGALAGFTKSSPDYGVTAGMRVRF
jgi:hypothetical protein